jgi:hypothetical protein
VDEGLLQFVLTDASDARNQIPFVRERVQSQLVRFSVDVAGMPGAIVLRDPRDAPEGGWRGQRIQAQPGERFEDVGRLLLAVEVLSPSTARADRVAKRTLFRDEGVDEYWIVDLDSRTIERSTPIDPRVEVLSERLEWLPEGAASPLGIDIVDYFARVLDR